MMPINSLPPYVVPTTILSLTSIVCFYLYVFLKNRERNKLDTIQSVFPADRLRAISMAQNDFGVEIGTEGLSNKQRYELINKMMQKKFQRYLITLVFAFTVSLAFSILIYMELRTSREAKSNIERALPTKEIKPPKDGSGNEGLSIEKSAKKNIPEIRIYQNQGSINQEVHGDKNTVIGKADSVTIIYQ